VSLPQHVQVLASSAPLPPKEETHQQAPRMWPIVGQAVHPTSTSPTPQAPRDDFKWHCSPENNGMVTNLSHMSAPTSPADCKMRTPGLNTDDSDTASDISCTPELDQLKPCLVNSKAVGPTWSPKDRGTQTMGVDKKAKVKARRTVTARHLARVVATAALEVPAPTSERKSEPTAAMPVAATAVTSAPTFAVAVSAVAAATPAPAVNAFSMKSVAPVLASPRAPCTPAAIPKPAAAVAVAAPAVAVAATAVAAPAVAAPRSVASPPTPVASIVDAFVRTEVHGTSLTELRALADELQDARLQLHEAVAAFAVEEEAWRAVEQAENVAATEATEAASVPTWYDMALEDDADEPFLPSDVNMMMAPWQTPYAAAPAPYAAAPASALSISSLPLASATVASLPMTSPARAHAAGPMPSQTHSRPSAWDPMALMDVMQTTAETLTTAQTAMTPPLQRPPPARPSSCVMAGLNDDIVAAAAAAAAAAEAYSRTTTRHLEAADILSSLVCAE